MLFLCNKRGMSVPMIAAKITTTSKEMLTTNPNVELAKTNAIP
jgi:hypothetical protein